jgi:hypothetical protein
VIIGIGHVAQTGKDTAAEALCRDLGFRRVSFADPLKALAKEANPIILSNMMTNVGLGSGKLSKLVDQLGWDAAKVQFPAVRQFLQDLGLGARKVFGPDFWVNVAMESIGDFDNVVIPDVRFVNEAEAIKYHGGKMVKIVRPGKVASGHISETALLDYEFDVTVENSGSVVELQQKITELARGWLAKEDQSRILVSPSKGAESGETRMER